MEKIRRSDLISRCRLCDASGSHEIDIWDEQLHSSEFTMSEKIFECVGLQAERDDVATKICRGCFDMINEYFPFRESCAAQNVNHLLQKAALTMQRPINVAAVAAIDKSNPIFAISHDEEPSLTSENGLQCGQEHSPCGQAIPIMCITVTDTESEDEEINVNVQNSETHHVNTGEMNRKSVRKQTNTNFTIKCVMNCEEPFESKGAMSYHMKSYHRRGVRKTFECHLCKKTFRWPRQFRKHMNALHTHQKQYRCPFRMCPSIFYHQATLALHIGHTHSGKVVSSSKANAIRRHRGTIPQFKCALCHDYFESKKAWIYHRTEYHARDRKKTFECHLCKRICSNRTVVRDHINSKHSRQAIFKCPFKGCPCIKYNKSVLKQHINMHHIRKVVVRKKKKQPAIANERNNVNFPVKCRRCKNVFESTDEMMYHKSVSHESKQKKTFQCYLCKKYSKLKPDLRVHMTSIHTHPKESRCRFPGCSATFFSKNGLKAHHYTKHSKKMGSKTKSQQSVSAREQTKRGFPFKCGRCYRFFESEKARAYHMRVFHAKGIKRIFECHLCKRRILDKKGFQNHMNINHLRKEKFICPFEMCASVYYRKIGLTIHINSVHKNWKMDVSGNGNFPVTCRHRRCNNVFEDSAAMFYHMGIYHAREISKSFECHLCRSGYKRYLGLRGHMVSKHTAQFEFKCTYPMCTKGFSNSTHLRMHTMAAHTNGLWFKCRSCPMKFRSQYDAKKHLLQKHSEDCHMCPISDCNRKFVRKREFEDHMASRHGEGDCTTCKVCKNVYSTRVLLRSHMKRTMHNTQQ